jgi:hypothetical protein
MKILKHIIFLFIVCTTVSAQQKSSPRFEDYKTSLFKGKIHTPKWIKKISDGEWRDDLGKLVESPEVNFARKYYVAAHSCGTGCRYYTMTDLSSGRELELLDNFASTEPLPKTSDGRQYLTILYYRYNSRLLIAQYLVDFDSEKEKCRERAFLFESGRLKPITK